MFQFRIMYATNVKPVFYPYTVTVDGVLKSRGWTLRWIKFHIQSEKSV